MLYSNLAKKHAYYNNQFFSKWARLYDFEKYLLFPIRRKAAQFFLLNRQLKLSMLLQEQVLKRMNWQNLDLM